MSEKERRRYKPTTLVNYSVCNKIKYESRAKLEERNGARKTRQKPCGGVRESVRAWGETTCVVDCKSPRGSMAPVREDHYSPRDRGKRSAA